jgi:hypothetical protein
MADPRSLPGAGLVTLVVPIGAESAPISHGMTQFPPYLADHMDLASRWLVDVPAEIAAHLTHNGGFAMKKQQVAAPPAREWVIIHHPEDPRASCGGERQPDGDWLVPVAMAAELIAHGWVGGARDTSVGFGPAPRRAPAERAARAAALEEQLAAPTERKAV